MFFRIGVLATWTARVAWVSLVASIWLIYAPLLSDWISRTQKEGTVRQALAELRQTLYVPAEAVELMQQEGIYSFMLATGCVGDREIITYGTNLSLQEIIHQYSQTLTSAGWTVEGLAKPDNSYAAFQKGQQSHVAVQLPESIALSNSDRQRFKTIYSVYLEYFLPEYGCST